MPWITLNTAAGNNILSLVFQLNDIEPWKQFYWRCPNAIRRQTKKILKMRQMSQQELADKSGVSLAMVKALANNKRSNTTVQTLTRICEALEVPVTYFLIDEDNPSWDFIEHLPEELQSFVLDLLNLDYLRISYLAAQLELPPALLRKTVYFLNEILSSDRNSA